MFILWRNIIKMKVNVKNKSFENNSVLLADEDGAEKWFPLADNVKMQYISIGKAEATVDIENEVVTYLKMDKPAPRKAGSTFQKPQKTFGGNFGKPVEKPEPTEENGEKKFYKTKHIVLEGLTGEELRAGLDVACLHNWVIATQTHFVDGKWYAVIYYKVKPE